MSFTDMKKVCLFKLMKIKIKREKKDITIISPIIQVLKKGEEESVNKILLRTLKEN